MQALEVQLGLLTAVFSRVGHQSFDEMRQTRFEVHAGHHLVGEVVIDGVVESLDLETLVRLLDSSRDDGAIPLLRAVRVHRAHVFGDSGRTIVCRVTEEKFLDDHREFRWVGRVQGTDQQAQVVCARLPNSLKDLSGLESAILGALALP